MRFEARQLLGELVHPLAHLVAALLGGGLPLARGAVRLILILARHSGLAVARIAELLALGERIERQTRLLGARFRLRNGLLAPIHLLRYGGALLLRRLGAPAQLRELQVVLRDERALRRDVVVDRVELPLRRPRRLAGPLPREFGLRDEGFEPHRLRCGLVQRGSRHAMHLLGRLRLRREEREPLLGLSREPAQLRLHRLETDRDAPRRIELVALLGLLQPLDAQLLLLDLLLQHDALGVLLRLIAGESIELGAQTMHVIGEQPRLRIPHLRRDALRGARDLGLPPERLQLTTDLAGEIAQPREVRLHRLELAQRALLAPPVLENPGGLLDEPPAILGGRTEHGVELALADDHVHLPAETRVAQQLLHVEQPARLPVDRVLARSVAEQRATDRDLGVLDGQRPIGVVDREAHLRATEGAARRRAREDDVLHLAAAQGLRALLPHDPGERVDDVRLARAVRPDDRGDAGLELEGGRLRERFEALEREALQMHAVSLPFTRASAEAYCMAPPQCGERGAPPSGGFASGA